MASLPVWVPTTQLRSTAARPYVLCTTVYNALSLLVPHLAHGARYSYTHINIPRINTVWCYQKFNKRWAKRYPKGSPLWARSVCNVLGRFKFRDALRVVYVAHSEAGSRFRNTKWRRDHSKVMLEKRETFEYERRGVCYFMRVCCSLWWGVHLWYYAIAEFCKLWETFRYMVIWYHRILQIPTTEI